MTPQELVVALLTAVFVDYDVEAARAVLAPDYIQHNPSIPTGADGLLGLIPFAEQQGLAVTTHRIITDGDLVVAHNTFENADAFGAPTLVSFDVFRVEDGLLAEHWDNLQAPLETTASGRSMVDGPTQVTDRDLTEVNRGVVQGFVDEVFLQGRLDRASEYIISEPGAYLQHNPLVPDGLDSLVSGLTQLAEAGQGFTFSQVHMIAAEGNFVFTMTEGARGGTPTAFFDLWRVENGLIVEHWDTIETIPADMAHDNGKF
ncbi:MAG: nuclear transport factor 2 family protein [Cohaesibacteraceae bacterium]